MQNRNRMIDMEIIWRVIRGRREREGVEGGKGTGIKNYKLVGTE